jgi:hypothetical protein
MFDWCRSRLTMIPILMKPIVDEFLQYLEREHSGPSSDIDRVIRDCAAKGYPIVLIIVGVQRKFQIPHGQAKTLVCRHPVWGRGAAEKWDAFHEMVIQAMESSERKEAPGEE